ncbi:MAG TPA: LamG-like jellyroll fold domain-containing protein, partial [Phycisphaerae bacterium]|nr:LamG-like jellyroll fold domain-containing protein [Phycisphaerae bacterium]
MLTRKLAVAISFVGLIALTGAAQTTTSRWTGGFTDGRWNIAANWDANGIPDANTDIAVFDDSGARLLVDLMTQTADVHQVLLQNAAAEYTINNGTIQLMNYGGARGRIEQFGSVAGTNTISAALRADVGGGDIVVGGGVLKLTGVNSTLGADTIATINAGGTIRVKDANGLGGSTINLAGGTLRIVTEAPSGPTEDGLIGRWDFEEGSGATTADGSTYGNDGTLLGGASFASDARIGGYSLRVGAGTTDTHSDRVNVGNDLPVFGQSNAGQDVGAFTLALWLKADTSKLTTYARIVGNIGFSGGGEGFNLTPIGVSGGNVTDLELRAADPARSAATLNTGDQWAHLLITYDHGTVQYFYDGVPVGMVDAAAVILGRNYNFAIGNTAEASKGWRGWLDDVRMYDRVLTVEEIDTLYNWDGAGGGPSGPVSGTNPVNVTADSTIHYINSDVTLGPLGLTNGAILTAEPNDAEVLSFTSVTMNGHGGIRALGDVLGGPVRNATFGPVTMTKLGAGSLTIAPVAAGGDLNDTTFQVAEGTLVASATDGNTSLGSAAVRLTGGTLRLGAKPLGGTLDARIDINEPGTAPGGNWNTIAAEPSSTPLIDFETGNATGVTFVVDSQWSDSGSSGTHWQASNPLPDWAIEAPTRDYMFAENGDANLTFTGLDPASFYRLELISTNNTADFRTDALFDVLEDGDPATVFNPYTDGYQAGQWLTWNNVQPDANGILTINVTSGPGPGSRQLAFINALQLLGIGDPTTYYDTDISVEADSAIEAAGILQLGTVALRNGSVLSVLGEGPTVVRFATTLIDPNGAATTGVNVAADTTVYAGEYSPAGVPITLEKFGAGLLVFSDANALLNDANSTLTARAGELAIVRTPAESPVPNSILGIDGGTLVLASADGSDVSFDNLLSVTGDGTLAAYVAGPAAPGATVTYVGDPNIPAGATLTFATGDGYTLAIEGSILGDGSASMTGAIDANGSIDLGGSLFLSGTVNVSGTTAAGMIQSNAGLFTANGPIVTSGAVDANGGAIIANDTIDANQILVRAGLLEAHGAAVSEQQVLVTGGRLEIYDTLDSNSGDPELRIVGRGVVRAKGPDALSLLSHVLVDKSLAGGGQLYLDVAQTTLPDMITVQSGALLVGDMGDANFNPGGNVFFQDEAVFGWSGGTRPNTDQLDAMAPNTRLLGAIVGGSAAESLSVGDDGDDQTTDDIYKGVSFGPWTEADFLGTLTDNGAAGLVIAMNDTDAGIADATLLSSAGVARFTGGGTLTWKGINTGASDVTLIERIGPAGGEDGVGFDVDPTRVLEASLTFRLVNTKFDVDNAAQLGNSTVIVDNGSMLRLDNYATMTGTAVLTGSGVVVSDDATRLRAGTDFQFDTAGQGGSVMIQSQYIDYTTDPGDTSKFYVDPNMNIILSRTSDWVRIGSSTSPVVTSDWVLGDGRAIVTTRQWSAGGISDNRSNVLLGVIRAVDGAEKIILGTPAGKTVQVQPAVMLGETNLQIGDSKPWSLPYSHDDNTRELVGLDGTIRLQGPLDANDVIVESGSLYFQNNRQGGMVTVNNILGSPGTGSLRFEEIMAFNIGTRSVAGSIVWRGSEVYIDDDSAFLNAMNTADPGAAFADEIVLGGAARLNMDTALGGDAKPWDPATGTRLIWTPIRIEAFDANTLWNHSIRSRRAAGSTNVHVTFMDITLEQGAILSMDEDNTTNVVNIKLAGDGTTTRLTGRSGGADDYEVYNVVST